MKNTILSLLLLILTFGAAARAQDKANGAVSGTVKAANGKSIANVAVEAKSDGATVASVRSDNKGDFAFANLKPGTYVFVFTKAGLTEGVSKKIEVKPNTKIKLKRLILLVDEGALAIVRGSVFDHDGRIARDVKVEIHRITGDGTKKIGEKFTNVNGEFGYSLPPDQARYRFVVKTGAGDATSKDLDVDGAEVYRFAITLKVSGER